MLEAFYAARFCHLYDMPVKKEDAANAVDGKVLENLLCFLDLSGSTLGFLRHLNIKLGVR